ncbi:TRAP transporter small permease [Falsirhodobacter halotolerans]|uniref:TRAP transporter small permease n=1 Tax=Falsirhodobacter halotolerans TaxID=1146892 RepID=UPI001FD5FAD3|nr:TRAP transporter small permease [Falsirhodobacter halotolerans]MCJ8138274.1 TRAP transporter small permease [Falsirhodobacter halotolerans]
MMEKCLDGLYALCGYLAAFFLAMIAVLTAVQIVARQFGWALETVELSGFCLAASTFFALAHTLVRGDHIRVGFAENSTRRWLVRGSDLWACAASFVVVAYCAWHMIRFTLESHAYGDLSPGLMAIPMWIPQCAVAFGLVVLAVALLHQIVRLIGGRNTQFEDARHRNAAGISPE